MKRFFCSTCKKIKHVRVMPDSVVTPLADDPTQRIGECRWHAQQGDGVSHARINDRGRVHELRVKRATVSTPAKAAKGRKSQNP